MPRSRSVQGPPEPARIRGPPESPLHTDGYWLLPVWSGPPAQTSVVGSYTPTGSVDEQYAWFQSTVVAACAAFGVSPKSLVNPHPAMRTVQFAVGSGFAVASSAVWRVVGRRSSTSARSPSAVAWL